MITYGYINQVPVGITRANAAQVFILALTGLFITPEWFLAFLSLDFALRSINQPRLSLLTINSKKLLMPLFRLSKTPTALKPKRFAASIGFVLSAGALILLITGYSQIAFGLLSVLVLFSFLESAFGFCAGCKVYAGLIRIGLIKDDDCEECQI